ncbi:hypothetical protein FBU30_004845 [Linnemannia zychae]|nr:hypothetical protein FBU30_004845 [Linnemannia zychae]
MTLRRRTSIRADPDIQDISNMISLKKNRSLYPSSSRPPSTLLLPSKFKFFSNGLVDPSHSKKPASIFHLPFEILVGQIFAILQLSDLAGLALVSKAMQQLCQTDYLWQRKFFYDFDYRPNKTLRQLGSWKRIYQAMDRVEVYTWGSNGDCRLGYGRCPKRFYESVPKRIRKLDGLGIVELAPTGWGCHALDKSGNVWAWGRIMESNGVRSDAMPRMLKRPRNVVQIAAGRQVVLAVDATGQLFQWCRENKAVEVTLASHSHQHTNSTLAAAEMKSSIEEKVDDPIVQIAAGWDICAALTHTGKIFAWRPPLTADGRYQHRVHLEHSVQLKEQGSVGYEAAVMDGDKFVGIAAGTDYIVAVTSLEKNQMEFEDRIVIEPEVEGYKQERVVEMRGRILGAGLFLPIFSEALAHTVTETYEEHDQWERQQRHLLRQSCHLSAPSSANTVTGSNAPSHTPTSRQPQSTFSLLAASTSPSLLSSSRPTTLSANFQNFALHHSSGKVLLGKHDVRSDTCPIVLDRLLSNACQVEFGDYHQGLLTEDGQLRTWGAFCEGALGQGDLRTGCAIPTVVEGPLKNRFVIKIGMAGWQSACLAIDMNEDRPFGSSHSQSNYDTTVRYGKQRVDDGYFSLDHTSSNGSGNSGSSGSSGSASEECESSDSEDWNQGSEPNVASNQVNCQIRERQSLHGSEEEPRPHLPLPLQSTNNPTSPWKFSSVPYMALSQHCTATCSLLVSPHSHRQGTATTLGSRGSSTYARVSPLRKRSHSPAENCCDVSSAAAGRYSPQRHTNSNSSEKERTRMMAMVRLNPTLTVYQPTQILQSLQKQAEEMPSTAGMPRNDAT